MSPHEDVAVPVQLARMEGTLNLVAERVQGLAGRVEKVENDVAGLKSRTQSLSESAEAARTTASEVASALERADEGRRVRAEQAWSPFAKTITALAAVVGVLSVVIQITHGQ